MKMLKTLNRDERGTTMTEFVICLPIWITMMIGIINLGKLGMAANAVELTAQKNLWNEVIPISDSDADANMFPIVAGGAEISNIGDLNVAGNNQRFVDSAELLLHGGGLIAGGHWGESYARLVAFSFVVDELDDLTGEPKDILGEKADRPYPHLLLNDSVQQDWGNIDSVEGIVTSFITGSGIVPALLAGNRYGVVFAEASRTDTLLVSTVTINAGAHFDTLVPPSPIRPKAGTDWGTFGGAFLLAQTIEQPYRVMQRYGKSEFDDFDSAGNPEDYLPDVDGELEEALEECEEQYEESQEECQDEQDDLEEGETLSQDCQDLFASGNPCQAPSSP